jgi:hypothetical protein
VTTVQRQSKVIAVRGAKQLGSNIPLDVRSNACELPSIPADIALLSGNFAVFVQVYVIGLNNWIGLLLVCLAVLSIIVQVCDM